MSDSAGRQYIDLHLHLIPNVDDGPKSEEETVELAKALVDDGVRRTAVTPHFNCWNPDLIPTASVLAQKVEELRRLLSDADVALEVLPGAEHFLTPELVDLVRRGEAPSLAAGPYILVELPFHERPLYADEILYQIGLAGLSPVLAHPERYSWVQTDPTATLGMVDRGIVLQCTAAGLSGYYGSRVKKTAETLLYRGAYGVVGSDLHHPGQSRLLSQMEATVVEIGGADVAQVLFVENPERVLAGEPLLPVPGVVREEPKKRLFGLFR